MNNSLKNLFSAYRSTLKDQTKSKARNKNLILAFFEKNGRWPKRQSNLKRESVLGSRFENYISKESLSYDANLRSIAMSTGRKSNNKRKHNVALFKQEILNFLEEHGRVPTTHKGQVVEGEARLREKLDYYTKKMNDMTLLGKIYKVDKCHLSGIPAKYRKIINEQLELEKPLIRMI